MLLRQLKYFITIVEEGSFTEAAYKCNISQSAISQQIQALESHIGVELLKRTGRSFTTTPAGEYLYLHGKGLLGQAEEVVRGTRQLGEDDELKLRIGYPLNYGGSELFEVISSFAELYPEVSISTITGSHESLYYKVRDGEADIVLNDQRRAFSDEYENLELISCPIMIELSESNQLTQKDIVDIKELRGLPCILVSNESERNSEELYYRNTLGFGESYIHAGTIDEARYLTAAKRGYFPIDKAGTLQSVNSKLKRALLTRNGEAVNVKYCLFWKKNRTNYYIEEFAESFRLLIRQNIPSKG